MGALQNILGSPKSTVVGIIGAAILIAGASGIIPMDRALQLFAALFGIGMSISKDK